MDERNGIKKEERERESEMVSEKEKGSVRGREKLKEREGGRR